MGGATCNATMFCQFISNYLSDKILFSFDINNKEKREIQALFYAS